MRARIARAWRDEGARGLLRRALDLVYVDWLLLGRDLVPEHAPPADPRLRFADLSNSPPALAGALRPGPDEARARLEAGHLCFAMLLDERPVTVVWARADVVWLPFLRRGIPLEPDEIYLYDSYTDPAHRRHGLTALRRVYSHTLLYERGLRRARAYVLTRNKPGLAASRAAGYEVLERHRHVLPRFYVQTTGRSQSGRIVRGSRETFPGGNQR